VQQRYLPEGIEGGWFDPKGHGYEREIIERFDRWQVIAETEGDKQES
jgi:hypothetical protein